MTHHRRTPRSLLLIASLTASAGLMACSDDDTADSASDDVSDVADPGATVDTSEDQADSGDDPSGDVGDDADTAGTLTVDGVTYSFTPSLCLPDDTAGSSVNGSGEAEDGTAMFVDMAAGNLAVYLGTDDPFSADPDYVANSAAGQGELNETVDGSTVSAEVSFTEHGAVDVVAEGSLEVTC